MSETSQCDSDLANKGNGTGINIVENCIEICYEDDDFELGCVEMDDCIEYNAPVGPNIVVTKGSNRDGHGGPLTSAISVAPRNSKISKSAYRGQTRGRTHGLTLRKSTPQTTLRDSVRRLQLGYSGRTAKCKTSAGVSVQIRKCSGIRQLYPKPSNSTLLTYPSFVPEGAIQKRLNSAKRVQIKDLMSKVRQLENTIEDVKVENRTLRTVHHRQDLALRKYEGADADLPKMLSHHKNEVHCLQTNLRKINARTRSYEDSMRSMNQKVIKLEQENKKLIGLVNEGDLEERHDLQTQLNAMSFHAQRLEEKLMDFSRHIEILEKNHLHQVSVETGKFRNSNKKLFDANQEIERLSHLIRQKDRIINYLRIRTCRNPDLEPPILKKMLQCDEELPEQQLQRKSFTVTTSGNHIAQATPPTIRQKPEIQLKGYRFGVRNEQLLQNMINSRMGKQGSDESCDASASASYASERSMAKDSGSGTVEEPTNPISQRQDFSEDEEDADYVTQDEDDELESAEEQKVERKVAKELDPNDFEQYYHFDPVNVDELSSYTPRKSLYLEALESSCNVSSLNSPHPSAATTGGSGDSENHLRSRSRINSDIFLGPPKGFSDTEVEIKPKSEHNPIGAAGDASTKFHERNHVSSAYHSKPESEYFGPKIESTNFSPKPEPANLSPSEATHYSPKTETTHFSPKKEAIRFTQKTETENMDWNPKVEAPLLSPKAATFFSAKCESNQISETIDPFHFYSKAESGFVSQRSDIVPSAEKVRLAQLKQRWNKPSAHVISESSDSHDDNDAENEERGENNLDNTLPIENMKMNFKHTSTNNRNLNNSNSFKDISRLNSMFKDLTTKGDTKPDYSIPLVSFPNIGTQTSSCHQNDFMETFGIVPSPTSKIPTLLPKVSVNDSKSDTRVSKTRTQASIHVDKTEIHLAKNEKPQDITESPKKHSGFAALESPIFSSEASATGSNKFKKTKGFFDNIPSPPPAGVKHFDFELASVFQGLTSDSTKDKSTESGVKVEVSKRDYHDNLTTNFQKNGGAQHVQTPVRKVSQTTTPIVSNARTTQHNAGVWK